MISLWKHRRDLALVVLAVLLLGTVFRVQYVDGMRASAAECHAAPTCARPALEVDPPPPAREPIRRFVAPAPPRVRIVEAEADPSTCGTVVKSVAWPPRWQVRCEGARVGLLGVTQPAGITELFVRADQSMHQLRVVALHESGHAWDFARLGPRRIARWCADRGCDPAQFFSGGTSGEGWAEPGGAEDWASVWDACHGGEYDRSYTGLAAPLPAQCALQNALTDYPR